ncbi:MAG: hypothetical protein A4E57_02575 [Syntrophorhabdaceae bacterium PtaU1.Bin034]|jgi:hypothetical protein|nr:MAG: hypothetical protein A4E57_02575 [Syntrophorhabdaceae bacterium PtaU1.Bin034]
MSGKLLESVPIWLAFVLTVALVLLSIHGGVSYGRFRKKRWGKDTEGAVSTGVGASLGLLAFILAFTFGLTASRFDARKALLLDEVNAIETAYLRAGLVPEPHRSAVRELLRQYVDIRVELTRNPERIEEAIRRSEALQGQIWSHAMELPELEFKNAPLAALFVNSLNEMFDFQTKRVTIGLFYRIPAVMWLVLFSLTVFSMFGIGYLFGMSDKVNWLLVVVFSLAFSLVILLIADLDRSGGGKPGIIKISTRPITDLQQRIK